MQPRTVFATRGPNPDDSLFTSIDRTPYTELLNSLHGGKRIQIGDYLEFAWSPSSRTWASTTLSGNYHENAGGAFLSWYDGTEHDGNTYAIANAGQGSGGLAWIIDLIPATPAGYRRTLATSPSFPTTAVLTDVCTRTVNRAVTTCAPGDSTTSGWVESASRAQLAFAPQGNAVYVAVNRRWREEIINPPSVPCSWSTGAGYCATRLPVRDSSVSVSLYMVDTSAGKPWTPVAINFLTGNNMVPGVNVSWLAIDETGTELVWELGKDVSDGSGSSCTQHEIQYIRLPNNTAFGSPGVSKSVPRPDGITCQAFGPATFSPLRVPWQPLARSRAPSRAGRRRPQ